MKNLYDADTATEVKRRIGQVSASSERQWGKMTAAQAVAHCSIGLELAIGDRVPERMFLGRLIGGFIKPKVVGDDAPMHRNSPTAPALLIKDDRDLDAEKLRLAALVDRFAVGPAACTSHPHSFFGPMTPQEWSILMYKHLDHHLRQFGT